MREMLIEFLGEEAPNLEVCGAVRTAEEALEILDGAGPDLMLIDVSLPGMSGIELVSKLRKKRPKLLCVLYTGHGEGVYVEQAIEAGARGYILKGDPHELMGAIEQVIAGKVYLSDSVQA